MKRCKKCGLPEIYTNIRFNGEGICNYCEFYEVHRDVLEDKQKLEQVFLQKMEEGKKKQKRQAQNMTAWQGSAEERTAPILYIS